MTEYGQDLSPAPRRWKRVRPTQGPSRATSIAALTAAALMIGFATAPRSTAPDADVTGSVRTVASR